MTYSSSKIKYHELPTDVEFLGIQFRECTFLGKFFDKFRLDEDYSINLGVDFEYQRKMSRVADGVLYVKKGFHWDGSSGPTIDDESDVEASLVHDELYGAMKRGKLSLKYRKLADKLYRDLLIQNGKSKFVAWKRYFVLRAVGWYFAKP